MGFYIRYETHQDGPYDLISMIRKIRKGLLPPETLVMEEAEPNAIAARLHPQLNSFFRELDEDYVSEEAAETVAHVNFSAMMRYGWNFFLRHMLSGMVAGLFVFATFFSGVIFALIFSNHIFSALMLISTAFGLFLCGFIYLMMQLQRQLPFSFSGLARFYSSNLKNLLLFAICFSLIVFAGFMFFIIPGLLLLSRLIFAPMLVIDRNFHFWHAIESSQNTVKRHGSQLYMTLIALMLVNVIAATLFVLPLLITLPVTFAAIIELYERLDFH